MSNYLNNENQNIAPGFEDPADVEEFKNSIIVEPVKREQKMSIIFTSFEDLDDYESKGE